jgi:hypothetical protein
MQLIYLVNFRQPIKITGCNEVSVSRVAMGSELSQRIKTFGAKLVLEGFELETVAIAMLGIGAALGLRFRIFVLLPIILLGFLVCTAVGLSEGISTWSITLTNVVGATCLQLGYSASGLLKFFIFSGRFDGTRSSQSVRPLAR